MAWWTSIQTDDNTGVGAVGGSIVYLGEAVIDGGQSPGIGLGDTSMAGGGGPVTVKGVPVGIQCSGPPSVAQLNDWLVLNGTTDCPGAPTQLGPGTAALRR